jgi:2-hydroxychromene-2-carboxylate isomerase
MTVPTLYYDLGSPYAYLALERAERVLGRPPALQPILVGAIFAKRGRGSWALTDAREAGMAEIERRAAAYGLPPLRWPTEWPGNTLRAMRAATWAHERGAGERFARVAFHRVFAQGKDITETAELAAVARAVGVDADELLQAIERPEIKDRLRHATDEAWERGVRGVPTVVVRGETFFGDDHLEAAATRVRA